MTPPLPANEKGSKTPGPQVPNTKTWASQFNNLNRMDKYVYFEELLNGCDETTQEMLITVCKKLPIYFEMEQEKLEKALQENAARERQTKKEQRRRVSSYEHSDSSYERRGATSRKKDRDRERAYSAESVEEDEQYSQEYKEYMNEGMGLYDNEDDEIEEEEEEEEDPDELYNYNVNAYGDDDDDIEDDEDYDDEDDDDDDDDLEESDEDDFVSGTMHQHDYAKESSIISDRKANHDLIVTYGTDGNDGFLGTLLGHCQCELLDFLINPLPREFGLLKCFLWYDRKEARINLYLDGPKPTLLMEARCTSRSHGELEFSGNVPQWHGAMTVFELHQVQASHVSHFNVFDGRRLPVREGVRTERFAQKPHVVAGAGGGVYSRLSSGPLSPKGGMDVNAGPLQLGAIQIKSISTKPREIMVLTPRLVENSSMGGTGSSETQHLQKRQSRRWDSPNTEEQMLQVALRGERADLCILHSREATFDESTQAYTMDFGERVKTASSKNVILQEHLGNGDTKMMTGKIQGMQYAVDVSHPMSLTHAFAVAIANITTKTIAPR